jgi:bacterioferritin-associated ferredoxin
MIVCLCEGVNDRMIQREIAAGRTTVRALQESCGAGRQCGSCCSDLKRLLQSPAAEDGPRGSGATVLLRR